MNAVEPVPLRRTITVVLIAVTAGLTGGRILSTARVYEPYYFRPDAAAAPTEAGTLSPYDPRQPWPTSRPEPMPTYLSNDRARWATIRALVEEGTYEIGRREGINPITKKPIDRGIIAEDGWQTIDKVLKPDTQRFYSSKPPLLATLLAGEYWLLHRCFGWRIAADPDRWLVVRTILLTVNWLPFLVYLVLLGRLVERFGTTDWGRLFVMAAACFGTFLSTFAVTLNNHNIGTYSGLFSLYLILPAFRSKNGATAWWRFALAGLLAGFTVTNELPAAAFAAGLGAILLVRFPKRTLLGYIPAAALPIAALFLTNYLAIGQLRPAYSEFGGPWYEYEGSPWQKPPPGQTKRGIDWAKDKESVAMYAFHCLLGHHGLFSLTPIWLLAVAAMLVFPFRRKRDGDPPRLPEYNVVAGLTIFLTVVVLGFYLFVTGSRNYGGVTSGLRWLMWLSPFWLLTMVPVADWLAVRRWGRGLAAVLLAISVASVSYPAWNPWRHPWLYNWLEAIGWIAY